MILAEQKGGQIGRPLEPDDVPRILSTMRAKAFAPAEYSAANLWLFRDIHQYRLVEGPVPHLRGLTYDGVTHALPLADLTGDIAEALFATGIQCLYPYGEEGPDEADRLGLTVSYMEADSDYWYRGEDMAALANAKARRAQARAFFLQAHPVFEPWSAALAWDAFTILDGWAGDITRGADETDIVQCREAIADVTRLGLEGGVVRAQGEPVAFLLASVRRDRRIVHFAKGRRAYSHAYPWMFSTYAKTSGAAWLNFEQDLGIPGLAQSKRAYAPSRIQPKFRLWKSLPL